MTAKRLIRELEKVVAKSGNVEVLVNADEIHVRRGDAESEFVGVKEIEATYLYVSDGDGFIETNKDGSERGRTCVVIG